MFWCCSLETSHPHLLPQSLVSVYWLLWDYLFRHCAYTHTCVMRAVLSHSVLFDICDPVDCSPTGSFIHVDSPGKNTEVGCHALLQGIFPTQESNPGLLHCRQIVYHLNYQGSPWILNCIAHPFSRDLLDPGIELGSPALQADSLPVELAGKPT